MELDVTLDVFSGVPNPEWRISGNEVDKIKNKLRNLPTAEPIKTHKSGYRGFILRNVSNDPDFPEQIRVFKKVLIIKNKGKTEYEKDEKGLEKLLIDQAKNKGYEEIIIDYIKKNKDVFLISQLRNHKEKVYE